MKIQKLYEQALNIVGKTEEGTSYPFMDRLPSLLNLDLIVLNSFRDDDNQLELVTKISDDVDLTNKEAQGLSLCLAYHIAMEDPDIPDERKVAIGRQRDMVMGSICTEMEQIPEAIDTSGVIK